MLQVLPSQGLGSALKMGLEDKEKHSQDVYSNDALQKHLGCLNICF